MIDIFKVKNSDIFKLSLITLVLTFFAELYIVIVENTTKLSDVGNFNGLFQCLDLFSLKHCILIFILFFIFLFVFNNEELRKRIGNFIYDYRYPLALIGFFMLVLFEIHGSSLGMWDEMLGGKAHQSLLGTVRPIRSDEWLVLTPLSLSQYFSSFAYFSPIPRAGLTFN